MKLINVALSVIVVGLFACNNEPKKTATTNLDSPAAIKTPNIKLPGYWCFAQQNTRDSFWLQLNVFENVTTGALEYKFKEKDSNTGELEGKMNGDTLIADYKFMSEGKLSTRQVAFLIKDSIATEGYGDMEEKDGKMVFKNPQSLTFSKGIVMRKVDCSRELPSK